MTKNEQYGLRFLKYRSPFNNNKLSYACQSTYNLNRYSHVRVIQQLNQIETEALIKEIDNALNGKYYEQYYTSDGVENESIELTFPNVIFGENDLIISMQDLKELLEEWLAFIS